MVWIVEEYYLFSYCLGGISIISVALSLYTTRKNTMEVKKQAQFSCEVKVHRYIVSEDEVETLIIDSSALVPGDIISIP